MTTHFIGIGGIGMSGLARLLLQRGEQVSGSDLRPSPLVEGLQSLGADVQFQQDGSSIRPGMRVVYSSAVKEDNGELVAARRLGCPLLHRSELLAHLAEERKLLAVTGTHGKTTTSSLLAWIMQPVSYALGGVLAHDGWNAGYGSSPYFVAEADESDGSMLSYRPHIAILTNSEAEHLDHYGSFDALQEAYLQFCQSADYSLWCADDPNLHALGLAGPCFGFHDADYQLSAFSEDGWQSSFKLSGPDSLELELRVPLPGRHNALNASAAVVAALFCGLPAGLIVERLAQFPGVGRRSQRRGEPGGILLVDDYAHHPTELAAALEGVRQAVGGRRIVAVYQPHRYTRTRDSLDMMSDCFATADQVYVTEIFGAGQTPIPGVSHESVLEKLSTCKAAYLPRAHAAEQLSRQLQAGDVLVTLGAGDITHLAQELTPLLHAAHA